MNIPETPQTAQGALPSVCIVVLNWNGSRDTSHCLESLEALEYPIFRVLVVDNGSTDDSLRVLRSRNWRIPVEILETGANLGYAGGNNAGITHALEAGADLILLLNNDTVVAPDFLAHLVAAASASPKVGVLGPLILYMDQPETVWFSSGRWLTRELRFEWPGQGEPAAVVAQREPDTDYICGAAMLIRPEVLRRVGLLDERFFLVAEESDWCFRARRAGYGCRTVPQARVWHKVGASFGTEASPLRLYFGTRNELLWAEKNLPFVDLVRTFLRSVRRHVPALPGDGVRNAPAARRIAWSLAQYARDWRRILRDPRQRASRLGLRDYLLRRFGNCPDKVRAISAKWSAGRAAEGGATTVAPGRS